MQIVFFGSSPFSVVVLEKLLASDNCHVVSVVTTPDRPVGRGLILTPNPVKTFAQNHQLQIYTDIHDFLIRDLPADTVAIVAAHGRRLGPKTLSKFSNHVYVIHPSLLPKYRGPSPIQQQILDGSSVTGVTVIQADLGEDTGPIVATKNDTILPNDTSVILGNRLFSQGVDLVINDILQTNSVHPKPQDDTQATFTQKITRASGFIPWPEFIQHLNENNIQLAQKLRAFTPWPGVWTINPEYKRIKLISLTPPTIQIEGKNPQPWSSAV